MAFLSTCHVELVAWDDNLVKARINIINGNESVTDSPLLTDIL